MEAPGRAKPRSRKMCRFNRVTRRRAFTLIELLIVVAIIGILAAIAIPNFLQAQVRAKYARAKADMRTLATALETYRVDHNEYPYFYLYRWEYPESAQPPSAEYGTLEQNLYELKVITTPIAYTSSIGKDPFGQRGMPFDVPYDYTSFKAFARANFIMGDSVWNARYTLRSRGPNQLMESMVPYDPTNGTVSDGTVSFLGNWEN